MIGWITVQPPSPTTQEVYKQQREAVAHVKEGDPVLPMLRELFSIVTQAERTSVQMIANPMLDYGQKLHFANQWTLSRDVFASLLKWSGAAGDHKTIAHAARDLGYVLKQLGQLDASDSAYAIALQSSYATELHQIGLRARLGMANNSIFRNQLIEADTAFKGIISEAQSLSLIDQVSDGWQGISSVAVARKDYHTAINACKTAIMYQQIQRLKNRQFG